jgi:hypothetical protein
MRRLLSCGLSIGALAWAGSAMATVNADSAANYSGGWTDGSNGGGGFGAWSIEAGAGAGWASNGIWASSSAGLSMGDAFGFTAVGDGAYIHLDRPFTQVLATGDVFTVDLGLNYDAGPGGTKGLVLRTADNREIVTVNQAASDVITINGVTALTNSGTTTMHWTFTQKTATQILVYATGRSGSEAYAAILTNAQASYLANIRFYASSISNDESADLRAVCFDNLVLSQGAGTNTFSYTVESNHTIVTGIATNASGPVVVPATLGGYPVTEIGRSAFKDRTNVTSITFASAASVTNIGPAAFQGCASLMLVVLPTGLTSISAGLFYGCAALVSATIPPGVTSIGDTAFAGCRGLGSLALPAGLTSVGESAFLNCRSLTSLDLPDGIKSVAGQLCYEGRALGSIQLPSGVTNIGYSAFYNCPGLTALALPASVKSIGSKAFDGCTGLTSLDLNSALSAVGDQAFYGCTDLQNLCFSGGANSLGWSVCGYCPALTGVYFVGNPPSLGAAGCADMFAGAANVMLYYLGASSSWGAAFCGVDAAPWTPRISAPVATSGSFTFTVEWASGQTIRVQASTNLVNASWTDLSTNTISGGSCLFSDTDWASYDHRYYRIVSSE